MYNNRLHTSVSYGGGFVNKTKQAILENRLYSRVLKIEKVSKVQLICSTVSMSSIRFNNFINVTRVKIIS